jgi:hypothetical protein
VAFEMPDADLQMEIRGSGALGGVFAALIAPHFVGLDGQSQHWPRYTSARI